MFQRSPVRPQAGPSSPVAMAAASGPVGLQAVICVLRRRLPIVIGTPVVLVVLTIGFLAAVTPRYTATATVYIDPRRTASTDLGAALPPSSFVAGDASVDSQVLLIQSPGVLRRVVGDLKLADDAEFAATSGLSAWLTRRLASAPAATESHTNMAMATAVEALQKRLTVVRQSNTFLIAVSATSHHPYKAAAIANAVVNAYFIEQARSKSEARRTEAALKLHPDAAAGEPAAMTERRGPPESRDAGLPVQPSSITPNSPLLHSGSGGTPTSELPEARVVAPADVPIRPSFPQPMLLLGLAPLFGLGLGCVLAFGADRVDRKVKTLDQAANVSGFAGLAAVPHVGVREIARLAKRGRDALERYDHRTMRLLPSELQPPLTRYAIEEPTSLFAEAVRTVRLALQRAGRDKTVQVVLVTSALDGEGKTTLAANLAASFAATGAETVLVDGDLRNPELTRSLCPRAEFGLIDVAMGNRPLHQTILVDRNLGLSVLPAPPPAGAMSLELVFSQAMNDVFADLRRHFRIIVIDAPPLVPLVDALALAERADDIILAVAWDRTPQEQFARAARVLSALPEKSLGVVLTQVDLRRLRLYDGYLSSVDNKRYVYGHQPVPTREAAE